jgi:hypothetical protein
VKLDAKSGKVLFHVTDNILDSMGLPCPISYDSRSKLIHVARTGLNQVFAFNALTGEAVWMISGNDFSLS